MKDLSIEAIGWTSSALLLTTLVRQVIVQWRTRVASGVSKWLFVGQLAASFGYLIYSLLLHNWVFFSSNVALIITAIAGECIYIRNRHLSPRPSDPSSTMSN